MPRLPKKYYKARIASTPREVLDRNSTAEWRQLIGILDRFRVGDDEAVGDALAYVYHCLMVAPYYDYLPADHRKPVMEMSFDEVVY